MASLADLGSVFNQAAPTGFTLAGLGLQGDLSAQEAQVGQQRSVRNFGERALPGLINSQAARGAYDTSATVNKATQLTEDFGDTLSDLAARGANAQAGLAVNSLLAQTGIRL